MFKFLGAFLFLYIIATFAQSTSEDDQVKGPNTNSNGKCNGTPIVLRSKKYPTLCLSTYINSGEGGMSMWNCTDLYSSRIAYIQFRYGDDGVFLLKDCDWGFCTEVKYSGSRPCTRVTSTSNLCNVTIEAQKFWFEAYGDEGYVIVRSAVTISDACSEKGPPSWQVVNGTENSNILVANIGSATEDEPNSFLWKIQKFDCRNES